MSKILIANWKMNPGSPKEAERLFSAILKVPRSKNLGLIIAPPFIYLEKLAKNKLSKKTGLSAQDLFWEEKGAFTGEVSPVMLKNLGVQCSIIGHSERRALGESDEAINKKVLSALKNDLGVVLCVGEALRVRRRGLKAVKSHIEKQLKSDLKSLPKNAHLIVAYEPIWAIGTGMPATPSDALEVVKFIRNILKSKLGIKHSIVLYGGSVDSKNIEGFVREAEIDGALVGGASLNAQEFGKMIKIAGEY